MATEKILIFDEAGNAKRMKVRIARFLDNEPVTASDKENIRTTLDVDDSLSGTFTTPLSVTSASDSSFTGGGRVGVGTSSLGSYASAADDLVVATTGATGVTIHSSSADSGAIYFADGTSGDERYRGIVRYNHGADQLELWSNSAHRWSVGASGNLVPASSGLGIDFGSAATSAGQGTGTTGSVSNSVLSDYEFGSWTPTYQISGTDFAALTMDVVAAQYVKIGKHVHCQAYIRTDNVDTTGALGYLTISGLPFVADSTATIYGGASIHSSAGWTNAPTTGYVAPNSATLYLKRHGTTGTSTLTASDLVTGAVANQNEIVFTASYIAST